MIKSPKPKISGEKIAEYFATGIFSAGIIFMLITAWVMSFDFVIEPDSSKQGIREPQDITYQIFGEQPVSATLPLRVTDVEPRTPITVRATIGPTYENSIRVETIYTAVRLYANDVLIYENGQPGSYPEFLIDPPTIITMVPLPDNPEPSNLRLEYLSPLTRQTVDFPRLEYGTETSLLQNQFLKNGVSLILALSLLVFGVIMTIGGLILSRRAAAAAPFIRIGIIALAVGSWSFGECPFSAALFPHPAILYLMAFCGLFLFVPPFLKYYELVFRPHSALTVKLIRYFVGVVILSAFILQLTGQVTLAQNVYTYETIMSIVLLVVLGISFWELIYHKNPAARRFVASTITIALFAFASFFNYEFRLIESITIIFQVGIYIFIAQLAWIGVKFFEDASHAVAQRDKLEFEVDNMNRQLDMQRKQHDRLVIDSELVKAMRHDLRHQLVVLRNYSEAGNLEGVKRYIDELSDRLPKRATETYCENYAVNAVAAHYIALAESEGVNIDVKLDIPENTGRILSIDICVIVGNLFENAILALRYLKSGNRHIKARAKTVNDILSVIIENNFDGIYKEKHGVYMSRDADGDRREGTGLTSVKAVCEKYDGLIKVEIFDNTWRVSILVNGIKTP